MGPTKGRISREERNRAGQPNKRGGVKLVEGRGREQFPMIWEIYGNMGNRKGKRINMGNRKGN